MGEDKARATDPNYPKGYSIKYDVVLSTKDLKKETFCRRISCNGDLQQRAIGLYLKEGLFITPVDVQDFVHFATVDAFEHFNGKRKNMVQSWGVSEELLPTKGI